LQLKKKVKLAQQYGDLLQCERLIDERGKRLAVKGWARLVKEIVGGWVRVALKRGRWERSQLASPAQASKTVCLFFAHFFRALLAVEAQAAICIPSFDQIGQ
jgi:hypothetical protein